MLGQAAANTAVQQNVGRRLFSGPYPLSTFVYNGRRSVLRPLRNPLYDAEVLAAAVARTSVSYFKRPQGTNDESGQLAPKTNADSNLSTTSTLAAPNAFAIFGFNWVMGAGISIANYNAIYAAAVWEFKFGGTRTYLEIPVDRIPQGVAPEGFSALDAQAAATENTVIHNGEGHITNFYPFAIEKRTLWIQPTETFKIDVTFNTAVTPATSNVRTMAHLLGMYYTQI